MNNTILIVDDEEINRAILAEIFKDDCRILEAANGIEAVSMINSDERISAVLLDLIMPGMNGIDVLQKMNESGKIHHIPVFIITAANGKDMLMEAYNLGAVDVISKPFMSSFVKCRINSIIELYHHRNDLEELVNEQIERLRKRNATTIETLASIIEFRDCESGEHVQRIRRLTDIIMTQVSAMYPEYYLTKSEIDKIVMASVLHDVGKISIPDVILTKPARLTAEEFEIMKQHTIKGCDILERMPKDTLDPDIYEYSYDICRHHHERWDGRGYPDGLKGDEITIWSQVVAIADVYDALTSPRVYKPAFEHDKAVQMILSGECGVFNPKVLEAFKQTLEKVEMHNKSTNVQKRNTI